MTDPGRLAQGRGRLQATDPYDAMLLFDEADALFIKRPQVRDSHDCYGNIEVN
jgi:hypothetical protein